MTLIVAEGKDPKTNAGGPGRPDKLTPEVQEKILAAARAHQRVEVAAELAGCDRDVFYAGLRTAAKAKDALAKGRKRNTLTQYERKCIDFSESLLRAMALAEASGIHTITGAATGTQVTETVKTKCIGKNENNEPIYATETTVTRAPGDWRAMAWWQEHRPQTPYRKNTNIEITGAKGGPIEIEFAQRLAGIEAMIKGGSAIPVDSEEVE